MYNLEDYLIDRRSFMKELNVCLMNDSFPPAIDGVANAVTNYGDIITNRFGKASVVTPFYPDADDSQFNFPVIRYPSLNTTKQVGYRAGIPFSADAMRAIKNSDFDVIHSHCPIVSTMLARAVREEIDKPIVFTYHTKFDIDIANAIHGKLLQEEAIKALVANISACDEVWTVSRGAGENLRKLGYQGEYTVMPNGVDFPKGRVDENLISAVTGAYDLPEEVPVFMFVGRMMWYKGIRITLGALKVLHDKGLAFRMVFIGGGNDKQEIVEYTETLGITDSVIFIPPIKDRSTIRAWYCRADLFLFPSTFDTNGLVVREAAACSLASVLIRGSCAAEDVDDGVSGFLIEENSASMAAKLTELYGRKDMLKRVGENASEMIYMSWGDAVANAFNRYGTVVEKHKSGKYPAHESFTDDVFRAAGVIMDAAAKNKIKQEERRESIRRDYLELQNDLQNGRNRIKEEFMLFRDDIRSDSTLFKEDLASEKLKIRERLEEIASFYERFR